MIVLPATRLVNTPRRMILGRTANNIHVICVFENSGFAQHLLI
jgi:hypothetical protein